jgi:hypothetical protein
MSTLIFESLLPLKLFKADATILANFDDTAVVTEHPIELGLDIADHSQRNPLRFTLRVMKTTTPILIPASPLVVEQSIRFFENAFGKLLTVVVPRSGTYTNCLLERSNYTIDENNGRILFDLAFKQVRLATAISILIAPRLPAPPISAGVATAADAGTQPTAPVPTPDVSVLKTVGGLLGF